MKRLLLGAAGLVTLGLAALVIALLVAPLPPSPPGPEPGRAIFHSHCATCHGPDGRGGSWRARLLLLRPGDLAGPETAALPDAYLADIIRQGGSTFGKPGMPSFGFTLTDSQLRALISYLRALQTGPRLSKGRPQLARYLSPFPFRRLVTRRPCWSRATAATTPSPPGDAEAERASSPHPDETFAMIQGADHSGMGSCGPASPGRPGPRGWGSPDAGSAPASRRGRGAQAGMAALKTVIG
jgi:mono/diheme cytochrome c family protein